MDIRSLKDILDDDQLLELAKSLSDNNVGYESIVDDKKDKLIDCPREIVINIEANVLNQNTAGEIVASEGIFSAMYHIPVPTGQPYMEFLNTFMSFFKEGLTSSAAKAWQPSLNDTNTNHEE